MLDSISIMNYIAWTFIPILEFLEQFELLKLINILHINFYQTHIYHFLQRYYFILLLDHKDHSQISIRSSINIFKVLSYVSCSFDIKGWSDDSNKNPDWKISVSASPWLSESLINFSSRCSYQQGTFPISICKLFIIKVRMIR